jgi:MSHA biogenesis protein MshM
LFSVGAIDGLDAASGGVPRLINVIGHKALMVAYGRGAAQVSAGDVRAAAADTDSAEPIGRTGGRWLYAAAVLALVVGLAALWGGWT